MRGRLFIVHSTLFFAMTFSPIRFADKLLQQILDAAAHNREVDQASRRSLMALISSANSSASC